MVCLIFEDKIFARIERPNCSNPDNIKEKIWICDTTGEIFKYVWKDDGYDIYVGKEVKE